MSVADDVLAALRGPMARWMRPRSINLAWLDDTTATAGQVPVAGGSGSSAGVAWKGGHPPVGSMMPYAVASDPADTSWLLCDGRSLLQASYPTLFTAIGTTYGSVDGTHFNIPDLRGRVPVALDNLGGSDAARLSAANTLGGSGGADFVALVLSDIPDHAHTRNAAGQGTDGAAAATTDGTHRGSTSADDNFRTGHSIFASGSYGSAARGTQTGHNNMQPYILTGYIIRVL